MQQNQCTKLAGGGEKMLPVKITQLMCRYAQRGVAVLVAGMNAARKTHRKTNIISVFTVIMSIAMVLLMTGCHVAQVPEREYYESVLGSAYGSERLCHHKARDYWEHLIKLGYDAYWVIGKMDGQGHSWVEYVNKKGEKILIEPTVKSICSGHKRKWYRNYKTIGYVDLDRIEELIIEW